MGDYKIIERDKRARGEERSKIEIIKEKRFETVQKFV